MAVRMPRRLPELPDRGEFYTAQLVAGGGFQTLAEYVNALKQWWFLRCNAIIVRPFTQAPVVNFIETGTLHIPLHLGTHTTHIYVAFGLADCLRTGTISAEVRKKPVEVAGAFTPGSGNIYDPGCSWAYANGDLDTPVSNGVYRSWGLSWHTTGLAIPADRDAGAPQSIIPRPLHVAAGAEQELVIDYADVCLNSLTIWHMYRSAI